MIAALFWVIILYCTVTAVIAFRAMILGPKVPGRVAFVISVLFALFPFLRAAMSYDGRGDFHPAGAITNLEWVLVGLALGPVHVILIWVILTAKRRITPSPV